MFTSLKRILATTAILVVAAAGVAAAHPDGGTDRAALKQRFDADQDGKLDASERAKLKQAFQARRAQHKAKRLAQFDANRDGTLDPAERQAMRDRRLAEMFARLDTDRDGKLSLDEVKAGRPGPGMRGKGWHGKRGQAGMHGMGAGPGQRGQR